MSSDDRHYEPPAVEDIPAEDGPAVTAAGQTGYGAITLMDDDGGKPGRRWPARLRGRDKRRAGPRA